MRQVTKQVMSAFLKGKARTVGNTHTDGRRVWLHGNEIASRDGDTLEISDGGGWTSATTKDRLNGLLTLLGCGASIHQRGGVWYVYNRRTGETREWAGSLRVFL